MQSCGVVLTSCPLAVSAGPSLCDSWPSQISLPLHPGAGMEGRLHLWCQLQLIIVIAWNAVLRRIESPHTGSEVINEQCLLCKGERGTTACVFARLHGFHDKGLAWRDSKPHFVLSIIVFGLVYINYFIPQ